MKKFIRDITYRLKCWNKWRKGCMNGPFHKFMVLFGMIESPTFNVFLATDCGETIVKAFNDGIQQTVQSFKTLADSLSELSRVMVESFSSTFEKLQDLCIRIDKRTMSPREYGRRLITKKGKDKVQNGTYRYIQTFQRNLPYQRRHY